MHELGRDERKEHERLVELLAECRLDDCLLVGPKFQGIALPHPMRHFPDTDSVRTWLQENPVANATILIKGSNSNRLWTLEELP